MKNKHYITWKGLLYILFTIYLLAMTWIILFKMNFSFQDIFSSEHSSNRSINLIPFQASVIINNRISISEIINNVIIFIPCGIYISCLFQHLSVYKKTSIFISISLIYETLQYIFGIGASDITDIITNTFGGVFGLLIYFLIHKLCKTENRTIKFITLCAAFFTIITIIFLSLLIFLN